MMNSALFSHFVKNPDQISNKTKFGMYIVVVINKPCGQFFLNIFGPPSPFVDILLNKAN